MENRSQIAILLIDEDPKTKWEIVASLQGVGINGDVVHFDRVASPGAMFAGPKEIDTIVIDPLAFQGKGLEILKELKNYPLSKYIPTIVYTTCAHKNWHNEICLVKPSRNMELAGAILRSLPEKIIKSLTSSAARAIAISTT